MPATAEPLVENPIVIGHEEDNPLNNTGMPAFGWVTALRRKGRKLFADIVNVFPAIAKLVRAKAYKHVSPEIYDPDQLPEGVPARGHMLRRLALLGGQLPHIKSLSDLPEPFPDGKGERLNNVEIFEAGHWQGTDYGLSDLDDIVRNFNQFSRPARQFSELACFEAPRVHLTNFRRKWQDTSRTWACFSEVRLMADDATTQVANAAIMQQFPGLPQELIASLTPDQMGMLATAIAPTTPEGGDATGMAEFPPDAPSREAVIAALVAQGQDQAALDAMSDEELIGMYESKMGGGGTAPFAEEVPTVATIADPVPVPAPNPAPAPVRPQPTKITTTQQFAEQLAELKRGLTESQRQLAAQQRQQRQRDRLDRIAESNKKKAAVRSFCEQLSKAGKASPAEVEFDKDGAPLGAMAFALSAASAVRKFSEGKEGKSDLEVLMEKLEQRPVRKFGEQVPDPIANGQAGQLSPERREQLLKLTGRGRSVLAKESEKKQTARMFAEQLAGVLNVKLNGQ